MREEWPRMLFLRIIVTALLFLLGATGLFAAQSERVLYISSYHPAFPTFAEQVHGIRAVFDPARIQLDIEFMDSRRFPEKEHIDEFQQFLTHKLSHLPRYDAVIVADDPALEFALKNQEKLFPALPIVFCGIQNLELAKKIDGSRFFTGVVEAVSLRENILLVGKLFPKRTRIAVIADGSLAGQGDMKFFRSVAADLPGFRYEVLSLQELSFDELKGKLRELGDDSAILMLTGYQDKTGAVLSFEDRFTLLRENSSVPVFYPWDHGVTHGAFGGLVISHEDQGREAAKMVLAALSGTPPSSIPVMHVSPNRYKFHHSQLVRFGVRESALPAGSIVVDRPLSFFEQNKQLLTVVLLVIAVLLFTIIMLLVHRRRLHQTVMDRTRELAQSEERWKFALEGARDGVWDWNVEKKEVYYSPRWKAMLGYDEADIGTGLEEWERLVHPEDFPRVTEVLQSHMKNVSPVYESEHRLLCKDGTWLWVLDRGMAVERAPDGSPLRIIGTHADISRIKAAEEKLRRSRTMLRLIIDTIPVRVFWKNRDLTYIGCNRSFAADAGVEKPGDIVGKNDYELGWAAQADIYRADDTKVIESGEAKLNYEEDQTTPDGKTIVLRTSKIPLTDPDGAIIGILGTYEDITDRKRLQDELLKAQKLEAVGFLAAGIAHDFNNLLTSITGYLSLLKMLSTNTEKSLQWIEQAESACTSAADLATQLLPFASGDMLMPRRLSIGPVVHDALMSLDIPAHIKVAYNFPADLPDLSVDERQIRQVFMNLARNAIEAMPEGGELSLAASVRSIAEGDSLSLVPGTYVDISVSDTGRGIREEHLSRIFDPYFTGKGFGSKKGQGLGLTVCHSIVTKHEGAITVASMPGRGTTFHIFLPALPD